MAIDFHATQNQHSYATRKADSSWQHAITALVNPRGKRVVDIGCGGGIYTQAWDDLGAQQVIGVDFSDAMIRTATANAQQRAHLQFYVAPADATGLATGSADIVFERALIHHLPNYHASFTEAYRLLDTGGQFVIQDRTPEDVQQPGSPTHLRGYFFDCFPRLLDVEAKRCPSTQHVQQALVAASFTQCQQHTLWEVRQRYDDFSPLAADLQQRTGRSILHELNDTELQQLIHHIGQHVGSTRPIVEMDRWTLWIATK